MADTPNFWGEPVPEAREDWENCLRAQVERDYNHPSIFAWVNFNETWGLRTDGTYLPETQEWVRSMYHLTKDLDPSRLVEDQSACNHDHVESDINSWHAYCRGFVWEEEIKKFVDGTFPGSTYNYIAGNKQNGAPMINSECGNVWGYEGSAGDCDFTWDYHIMMDAFRRYPKCAGWLYTEHHDVINEWNGYVKYDRSPKIDGLDELVPGMTIADFQSPYYISPEKYLYTENEAGSWVDLPLYASFMTDKDPGKLTISTELVGWDGLGNFKTFDKEDIQIGFEPYLSRTVASQKVHMPEENGIYLLRIVLRNDKGEALHHNFTTFRIKDGKATADEKVSIISFAPSSYSASEAAPIPAVDVKTSGNGVSFTRYKGDFLSTSEMLAKGTIDGKGVKPFFGIDEAEDEDHFGYVFDTWLKVEQTGIHQFNIISDDGAVMFVDGKEVLNVDGSHPDRSGWAILDLEKGMHHIELRYFEDFEAQKLDVVLTCPDGQNGPIPAERLFISAD